MWRSGFEGMKEIAQGTELYVTRTERPIRNRLVQRFLRHLHSRYPARVVGDPAAITDQMKAEEQPPFEALVAHADGGGKECLLLLIHARGQW
jgi:hypothetical protein